MRFITVRDAPSVRDSDFDWFYFSGGENSGASQPHKHIQFIPLYPEDPKGPPIEHLASQVNLETSGFL